MEDDMDGDMEGSGSGSGSQEKETVEGKITDLGFGREDTGPKKKEKSGGADFELEPEHPWDRTPRVIQSKSIMESKEVLTGVVAGGVGGLILAVGLAGFLIYKWKKKDLAQEYRAARSTETGQDYIRDQKGALRDETVVLV
ncbi:hypothetical protein NQD34_017593 [Periophthalmus magnuspinnatus]|nr:hypothetical protein NQD34_017593 [Periophthalmus magnuspinnatus]